MNSQQSDRKINTSCKDCVFAIYDSKTQSGCDFDRITKFENVVEAYDEDKEFFVIPRLCTYYRDSDWNNGFIDKNLVRKESGLTFDVFFDLNKISNEYIDKLDSLISYMNWGNDGIISSETFYDLSKIQYRMFHNQVPREQRNQISQFYMKHANASLTVNELDDGIFLHDKLMKTRNTYHVIISSDTEFDVDILIKANELVNDDLKKALLIKHKDVYIVSNLAYKMHVLQSEQIIPLYSKNIKEIIESIEKTELYFEI